MPAISADIIVGRGLQGDAKSVAGMARSYKVTRSVGTKELKEAGNIFILRQSTCVRPVSTRCGHYRDNRHHCRLQRSV